MKIRVIITLVFVALLGLIGIFNQEPVKIILLGFPVEAESLGIVVLSAFLTGGAYVMILALLSGFRLRDTIHTQKCEIRKLKELCGLEEER